MPKKPVQTEGEVMADDPWLVNHDKQRKLTAKLEAHQLKIRIAKEENPPGDTSVADSKVIYWEQMRDQSLMSIRNSIEYQTKQIDQIRLSAEKSIAAIQVHLSSSERSMQEKEAFFAERILTAQLKVRTIKEKVPPKLRKLQIEEEAMQKEIESLKALQKYGDLQSEAKSLRETKKNIVVEEEDDDDDDEYNWYKHGEWKEWCARRIAQGKPTN